MKIIVLGGNGQLGSDCVRVLQEKGHTTLGVNHDQLDITDETACRKFLTEQAPQVVINTAAFHNVDNCEKDPAKALMVNAIAPRLLAILSNELNFKLIHISTDYVFDGAKNAPYLETDTARPLNVYGNSKLSGELFVQTTAKRFNIVRTSAIYGENPCRAKAGGNNFVKVMLKLAKEKGEVTVVDDEFVSPTYTVDVAHQLLELLSNTDNGIVHCTSQGSCSWHDFAAAIFKHTHTTVKLNRAAPGQFPIKVARPKYSVLENKYLQDRKLDKMPHWEDALKRYLKTLAQTPTMADAK